MDIKYIQICCLPFCPSSVLFHTFYRFHDTYARSFVDIYKICIKVFVTERITIFPDYTEQRVIERIYFDTAINLSKFFHHIHIHILYITSRMLTMYVSAIKSSSFPPPPLPRPPRPPPPQQPLLLTSKPFELNLTEVLKGHHVLWKIEICYFTRTT